MNRQNTAIQIMQAQVESFFLMLHQVSDPETGDPILKPLVSISQETRSWLYGISRPHMEDTREKAAPLVLALDPEVEIEETETGRIVRWAVSSYRE